MARTDSGVSIRGVSKSFGAVDVLDHISLGIESGEFVVFLGASGSGKSTLLRMIAGLETVSGGEIWIGGRRVDQLAPGQRDVSMVFQSYALYPHMSVRENLAFGLVNVGTPKAEIATRISTAARMLEMDHLLERKPAQLSGGQRQRVAIGRAIVREPKVFLFDEPLSNLDAGLRTRTRLELSQLHERLGATMVFVTHDQVEAMTLATRIVLLNKGKIEQVGTPMDIYARPSSRYVAQFVGSPAMNFLPVGHIERGSKGTIATITGGVKLETAAAFDSLPQDGLALGLRPENLTVSAQGTVRGMVVNVEQMGDRSLVHARLADGTRIIGVDAPVTDARGGDEIAFDADGSKAMFFDETGKGYHAAH
ncbi:sn-glycerol-3-phosphate ABC transporter ATP-binding protein UgpC [Rhizobium sp. P38BS-XIX]|uniref:sn-glycerol-3-phosphate ABC transporter ATP-binding protein UgpC n=1 Tax=Rhizobium sp. P38BS-XIX TaxID=2726740 RepID=UPI0014564777|nr:sn-glycerol-3-phosphate ABC transporter ATP-binding protein UgpC [Rhizobium sp. P38BS-XIX]